MPMPGLDLCHAGVRLVAVRASNEGTWGFCEGSRDCEGTCSECKGAPGTAATVRGQLRRVVVPPSPARSAARRRRLRRRFVVATSSLVAAPSSSPVCPHRYPHRFPYPVLTSILTAILQRCRIVSSSRRHVIAARHPRGPRCPPRYHPPPSSRSSPLSSPRSRAASSPVLTHYPDPLSILRTNGSACSEGEGIREGTHLEGCST